MGLWKQKSTWIGLAAALAVALVVGVALLGTVMQAAPNGIPVGLVVLDQGADGPDGTKLQLGESIKQRLLGMAGNQVKWHVYASAGEAMAALDRQEDYGTLILPDRLSDGFLKLAMGSGQSMQVDIVVSEGKNAEVAGNVKRMLHQAVDGIGKGLAAQLLEQIGKRSPNVPVAAVKPMLDPLQATDRVVHPVGTHSAGGNAPSMLTLLGWIVSLVASVFLHLAGARARRGSARPAATVLLQLATGLAWMAVCAPLAVWMAAAWYGMEPTGGAAAWLFLWLGMSMFFLLQTALLNAIGLPAVGLLVLLLFFSIPVVNLPPELLPAGTKAWLYAWTPLRFVVSGLRDALYFGGVRQGAAEVVWWIAGVCAALGLATGWMPLRASARETGANG